MPIINTTILGLGTTNGQWSTREKHVIGLEIPKQKKKLLLCTNRTSPSTWLTRRMSRGPPQAPDPPATLKTRRERGETAAGPAYAAYGARDGVNPFPPADPPPETRGPMLRAWAAPSPTVRSPSDAPPRPLLRSPRLNAIVLAPPSSLL
jgi:hypothetical protein